jgi:hypothetical protein
MARSRMQIRSRDRALGSDANLAVSISGLRCHARLTISISVIVIVIEINSLAGA